VVFRGRKQVGQKIDFRNTIIIMTSNVGAVLIKRQTALGFGAIAGHGSYEAMRDKILDESKRVFKPEFFVREHQSRCMVVDPLSAIAKAGAALAAGRVAERLICLAKSEGITLVSTSLLQGAQPLTEETPVQISTIADTWIHLTNISRAGERNRALSIVKSRGMKHSNQVRELILSDEGIALADVYTAAGDLLMGTARWQKEAAEKTEQERILAEVEHKRSEVAPTIPGWSWPLDFSHGVGLLPLPVEPCASRLGH
jgi:hypothetical protein